MGVTTGIYVYTLLKDEGWCSTTIENVINVLNWKLKIECEIKMFFFPFKFSLVEIKKIFIHVWNMKSSSESNH